ncbi:EGF-like domain-containing protein [Dictyostelium discoideum AX4]|uniref:EGF-like domain-containing protein n=1 Tax=Dictyostelium discoideum TaxID=44689 RepID=Q54GM9_DICDI|nr:EGF-like domain-containing protein [Dictyostelium discoideum AX4]EAL62424.1 EGF-like domain-containing protein [Dictyostelium discoideum AX4]|eukprot:XP_635933.1 EGF-like domain-containing protein [Dictyostelium discoideum AX4]
MNKFYVLSIFIIFFFIKLNESQLTPLTPQQSILAQSINSTFSKYPKNNYECSFEIKILIEIPVGKTITSFSSDLNNDVSFYQILNNNNYYIFTNIQGNQKIGTNSQVLTFTTSDNFQQTYQLNTNCLDIDIDKVKVVNSTKPISFSNYFLYYIILEGLEPGYYYETIPSTTAIIQYTYFSNSFNYCILINQISYGLNLTKEYEITMNFNDGKSFSFKLDTYYSLFKEKDLPTTHFETFFPSNILSINSNYTQMSYGYQPLFTSTLNTNIMKPYQVFNSYVPTIPLKGYKGNMTFIGAIDTTKDPINSGVLINSTLMSEIGVSVDLITFTTKINVTPIPILGIESPFIGYTTVGTVSLFYASFRNSYDYQFSQFQYFFISNFNEDWPYGFISGTNSNFSHQVSFPRPQFLSPVIYLKYYFIKNQERFDEYIIPESSSGSDSIPPILKSYNFTRITNFNYLFSLDIESVNGVKSISVYSGGQPIQFSVISGTIYNGSFELIISFVGIDKFEIKDTLLNSLVFNVGTPFSANPLNVFNYPQSYDYEFNFNDFTSISFLKNNLDLNIESESYNIIYLNSPNIPQDIPLYFSLLDIVSSPFERNPEDFSLTNNQFIFNSTSGLFECKFILPKNNMFGMIPFQIHVGNVNLFDNSLMNERLIVNNTVLDYQGPIFSYLEKIGNGLVISTTGTIGWKFNITDDLNGFESGYIKVMGSIDSSTYHFNFTIDDVIGDKFNCQYQILINITQPCISQEYRIVKVLLFDTNKISSKFILNGDPYSIINPFINLLDKGIDNTILPFTCSGSTMFDSKPILLSFTTPTTTIDVGSPDRIISFDFSINPGANGIKQDQLPIIYLTTVYTEISKCNSKLISYSANNAVYNCSTELPLGFGYPGIITISMYGIVNNGGYYYGYSTSDIQMVLNSNYYLDTTYSSNLPVITSSDKYYSDDNGEIIIYGRGFINVNLVTITYSDSGLSPNSATTALFYGSSAIKFSGIKKTNKLFKIKVSTAGGFTSNEFSIQPIYFDSSLKPIPTETPTPTTTPTETPTTTPIPTTTAIPTTTPIPTNPPQKCLGNPQCGGKNQGYFSSTGCICYSPWIGVTCTSQIIIVPQPSINTTKPDVEIPTDNNGQSSETNSEESQKMIFKSLISLVSLRELDFNNKEVNNYKFDQWIYTPINEFKNQYFTTVSNTNITAALEWFNQSTPIQFANQNLTMNPSSIKYTIEITEYQFKSSLNQLQLVMAASLTTNSNDICTLNQFGNTSTGDDSNYLKIQIENHSLYGRFIKRAIIDNNVKSISNVLLDSSLNVIDSSSSSLQSFIGITIPNYRNSIIVDPDFSVLVDSKSASDEDDSVCTKNNSGLTTAQLAGIIVGSIAFAAVIVITIVYFIIKRNKQKKFIVAVNKKITEMNNNK